MLGYQVDYQPGGSSQATDPLADYATCSRDIPIFKELGLNTIRVYTVDNSANHDQCMAALADAGKSEHGRSADRALQRNRWQHNRYCSSDSSTSCPLLSAPWSYIG